MVGIVLGAGISIVLIATFIFFVLRRIHLRSECLKRCTEVLPRLEYLNLR